MSEPSASEAIGLHPNPVKDMLRLEIKDTIEVNVLKIYNTLGQLVMDVPHAKTIRSVDVSALKSGNYFLKIDSNQGSSTLKFMKI